MFLRGPASLGLQRAQAAVGAYRDLCSTKQLPAPSTSCISPPSKLVNPQQLWGYVTFLQLHPHLVNPSLCFLKHLGFRWGFTSAFSMSEWALGADSPPHFQELFVTLQRLIRGFDMGYWSLVAVFVKVHFGSFSAICVLKAFSLKSHLASCSTSLLVLSVLRKENCNRRYSTNS